MPLSLVSVCKATPCAYLHAPSSAFCHRHRRMLRDHLGHDFETRLRIQELVVSGTGERSSTNVESIELVVYEEAEEWADIPGLVEQYTAPPESPGTTWQDDQLDTFSDAVPGDKDGECGICYEKRGIMRQLRSCGHRLCGECLTALIESGHERSHCCPFDRLRMFEDAKEELEQMEEFERTMDALSESAWMVILPRSPYEAP